MCEIVWEAASPKNVAPCSAIYLTEVLPIPYAASKRHKAEVIFLLPALWVPVLVLCACPVWEELHVRGVVGERVLKPILDGREKGLILSSTIACGSG